MTQLSDRLIKVVENEGVNVSEFCKKFGIDYAGFNKILNNKRELGMIVLNQIKKAVPDLDTEWLLFGTERAEYGKYDNTELPQTKEEFAPYGDDPVKEMFLKYLDNPAVQEKVRAIINKK